MKSLLANVKMIAGSDDELPPLGIDPAAMEGSDGAEQLDPDPEPGRRSRRRAKPAEPAATARKAQTRTGGKFTSRATVQKGMQEEIEMYLRMLALAWSATDPDCGGALNETSARIAEDAARLCARSDWLVERFGTTSLLADIAKLAAGSFPLIRAVMAHHGPRRGAEQHEEEEHERVTVASEIPRYAPFRPAAAV